MLYEAMAWRWAAELAYEVRGVLPDVPLDMNQLPEANVPSVVLMDMVFPLVSVLPMPNEIV